MPHLDEEYPWIKTPNMLLDIDPYVSNFFRKELQANFPKMYEWRWMEGISIPMGTSKDYFKDQMFWHINQKYVVGTGRMVESCEKALQ